MKWQPIDTAPKDGTRVILFYGGRDKSDEGQIYTASWCPYFNGWEADCIDGFYGATPTHWQPLPEPPNGPPA